MTTVTGAFRHYAKAPKESVTIIRTQKGNYMWVNRQHSVLGVVCSRYTRYEQNGVSYSTWYSYH